MASGPKSRRSAKGVDLTCLATQAHEVPEIVGLDPCDVFLKRSRELASLLWYGPDVTSEEATLIRSRADELYQSLNPVDGIEGMLAMQIVGTHNAALECLRRAHISSQTFEGRDLALKHAEKLMALFTKQLATLDKHRGKGQQKITVERVNVESGGQAVIGNVETGQTKKNQWCPRRRRTGFH